MNIRSRLGALTFATLLPMAIFGAVGAYMLVQRERDSFERGALDRVRALMTAIDAELRASITPLEMLARSPTLIATTSRNFVLRPSERSTAGVATGSTSCCLTRTRLRYC